MVAITFKVTPEEARAIRAAARAAKLTLSSHIRAALFKKVARRPRIEMKRHPISGLPYNAAGSKLREVSLEEIKAALADFP